MTADKVNSIISPIIVLHLVGLLALLAYPGETH
ncbi:hypothetical protein UNH65_10150 [Chitinophaga sp. 180180018-2]|nr:hypothetical protein [Chitinophaga sp. 212800010-3]